MKKSTKELLEEISNICNNELTVYKFSKTALQVSDRYRQGRIIALNYVQELIYHYLQEEKNIQNRFINSLKAQQLDAKCLKDGEYKQAILETIEDTIIKYEKYRYSSKN